ncbi:hypothetical protein AKJ16_DCAP12387, partial [Drosera capensis]
KEKNHARVKRRSIFHTNNFSRFSFLSIFKLLLIHLHLLHSPWKLGSSKQPTSHSLRRRSSVKNRSTSDSGGNLLVPSSPPPLGGELLILSRLGFWCFCFADAFEGSSCEDEEFGVDLRISIVKKHSICWEQMV